MTSLPAIQDIDVKGKIILIRADLNVPLSDGKVGDATRIERFAPTIKMLSQKGAKVVILTHIGRPKGEANPAFSTLQIMPTLEKALGQKVQYVDDCIGEKVKKATHALIEGEVMLLENIRFYKGEEKNEHDFAAQLAQNGDIFVNDAFSVSHRAHASTHGITDYLPSYAGPSLLAEVNALTAALETPKRPVVAVVGGAKVSTKIAVLNHLSAKLDHLIIGGGMANTFLAAQGKNVGKSLCEHELLDEARVIIAECEKQGCQIHLPIDVVVAQEFKANADHQNVSVDAIPKEAMALDSGNASIEECKKLIENCATILWNGPLGAFEISPFGAATFALAQYAAQRTKEGKLISVAGGGDTVAALNMAEVGDDFTYVSTAGGAFLEWLEGKDLPGISALMKG